MKLNSNTAFNLLGIAFMVILIGALMLAGWAGLSKAGIIVTGVVVALIGDFAAIMLLLKYSKEQNEVTDGFNINEVRVQRTAVGTSVEILVGLLVALSWALTARNGLFTDIDGNFSYKTLFRMICATVVILFVLWDTYYPGDISSVGKLTNLKQVKLAITRNRLFAVLLAVGMLFLASPALHDHTRIALVLVAMLVVVFVTFSILISKARDQR